MNNKKTRIIPEKCIGCGMCMALREEIYGLDEETGKAFIANPDAFGTVLEEELQETIDNCPTGAIEFEEEA